MTKLAPTTCTLRRSHPPAATPRARLASAVLAAVAASLPAQQQFAELARRHLPTDTSGTSAIAFGDIDGDGDPDMVVGNGDGQSRLYRNDGHGIFTDVTATAMPVDLDATNAVALGDVDGDGDLDIVFGNGRRWNSQQSRLYRNNGQGVFTDATSTSLPVGADWTGCVALGDVDGDGDLDLVAGNRWYTSQNRLYVNDGQGVFTDATAGHLPNDFDEDTSVAIGDVDGDGDQDLVFACGFNNLFGQQNRLLLNNGQGVFTDGTPARMPVAMDFTTSVAIGDVDGDGDRDLLFGNWNQQNRLYLNNGQGFFADATATNLPVDVDPTTAAVFGDVDADGDLDIVLGNGPHRGQQNRLYVNNGQGVFTDGTQGLPVDLDSTMAVAVGDVDGDGDLDVAFGNYWNYVTGQERLCLNEGNGTFVDACAPRLPPQFAVGLAIALGDVNGDGHLDLVFGNFGQDRLCINRGDGTFVDATAARMPVDADRTSAIVLGDVDGDGDLDLIHGSAIGAAYGQTRLSLNDGQGTFTDATATNMPIDNEDTTSLALGDVDADGDLDLVIGNQHQQNRLYVNNGLGAFTDATASAMPIRTDGTTALALGDVDGDGDPDLVIGNFGQQNRLYLNDGLGAFHEATLPGMPIDQDWTQCVALGDVDGDGDLDLVIGNYGQDRLYVNNGAGAFTDATTGNLPPFLGDTPSLALGDVDGDGDRDLVLGESGYYGAQNRLYLNNGLGTFTDATQPRMPAERDYTRCVALGDVDGDLDLDLAVANSSSSSSNRLHINLLRQLDAPHLLRTGRPFTLEVHSHHGPAGTSDFALAYLSVVRFTPPIPFSPYGMLGIRPDAPLPLLAIPQPGGVAAVTWNVPNAAALAGIHVHGQALLVNAPVQMHLTNVTDDVLRR